MSYLHSIYLTGDEEPCELPPGIRKNVQSLVDHHPGFEHRLWDDASGRKFLAEHFDAGVVAAWDELVPLAYRADLLRYCLLYQLGGLYADVTFQILAPVVAGPEETRVMLFRDLLSQAPWIVSNALIHAPPELPFFKACADRIQQHVKERHYGANPLCPTGPNLLGKEIAIWGELHQISLGECVAVTHTSGGRPAALAYLDAKGNLVAIKARPGSGLAKHGANHQDDYNTFYRNRTIYHSERHAPIVVTASEYIKRRMCKAQSGTDKRQLDVEAGHALFGPYVSLDKGDYEARFIFSSAAPAHALAEVVSGDRQILKAAPLKESQNELSIAFALEEQRDAVEIRLILDRAMSLPFDRLEIRRAVD